MAQHLQQRSVAPPTRGPHTPTSTAVALVLRATCGPRGRRRSTVTSSHPHPSKHRPPRHHHPAVRRQPARKGGVSRETSAQDPAPTPAVSRTSQPRVAHPDLDRRGAGSSRHVRSRGRRHATVTSSHARPSNHQPIAPSPPNGKTPAGVERVSRETSDRARVPSSTAVGSHCHPSPISTNTTGAAVGAPLDGSSASCRVHGSRSPTHSRLSRRVAPGSPPIVTPRGYARALGASVSRETFDSRRPRSARLAPSSPGVSATTGPNRR